MGPIEKGGRALKRHHVGDESDVPVAKQVKQPIDNEPGICDHCREIDFQRVLDPSLQDLQSPENIKGILIADLGTRYNNPPTNGCSVCEVFHISRFGQEDSHDQYQLRAYYYLLNTHTVSWNSCHRKKHRPRDIPCLRVLSTDSTSRIKLLRRDRPRGDSDVGHIFMLKDCHPDNALFRPHLVDHNVDFTMVKGWLKFCTTSHKHCQASNNHVFGLKLIDCESMCIVHAPKNAKYDALSYVWEAKHSPDVTAASKNDHPSGHHFERTIQDALVATKSLGYRYLWVDKYCIDQNNAAEKHDQISQMDTVYEAADMTIIASAGHNAHCELPGISGTHRLARFYARIGNLNLIPAVAHPHGIIPKSPWAARGWTFQEAVLSRRRLVFTEDQVYFECRIMNCCESMQPDLIALHKGVANVYACFHSGILAGNTHGRFEDITRQGSGSRFYQNLELIEQYSAKTLSFEADRLNAFRGIMNKHATYQDGGAISQVDGVPYYSTADHGYQLRLLETFCKSLLWLHEDESNTSNTLLDEDFVEHDGNPGPSDAEPLPSWSWAGWQGRIHFAYTKRLSSCLHDVRLEFAQNSWVSLSHFYRGQADDISKGRSPFQILPQALHLEVYVLLPSVLKYVKGSRRL